MKILFFDWGAYTYQDIAESFRENGVIFRTVSYHFGDKNQDDFFEYRFKQFLREDRYDAVFSVNYFPLVAKCCAEQGILYISWSYDNPLNVPHIEDSLGYDTNRVFLFDRVQVAGYQRAGFDHIFHMPLGVNIRRLDGIKLTRKEEEHFSSDISFVGKLYDSALPKYMALMTEYQRGYLEGAIAAQGKLYGAYVLEEMLSDSFLKEVNQNIEKLQGDDIPKENRFVLTKEALAYATAAQVTRNERLLLLKLLSNHHQVKLYTREQNSLLDKVTYMGSCGYLDEMPRIFKASRVNLNITLKILQSGVPLRAMDIMGAGGFLLSNYQPELAEYFVNNEELVMYESVEDAYAKADFYLKNEDLRSKIAKRGHAKMAECYTYDVLLREIFDMAGC